MDGDGGGIEDCAIDEASISDMPARARMALTDWPPLLARRWVSVRAAPAVADQDGVQFRSLRVMTFNILADSKQGEEEWSATPPEALDWERRKLRLLEEIMRVSPDIVCFQELDHVDDFFKPELEELGYGSSVRPTPAPATDACAIFFRAARLQLLEERQIMDFAALALLQDDEGRPLVVASTHLKSGKDPASEAERATQVRQLLDNAKNLAAGGAPVVVGADLNAEPITSAKIGNPLAYPTVLGHELGLRSAYAEGAGALGGESLREAPYTTWKRRPNKGEVKRTIDFIFYSSPLQPLALLEVPDEARMPEARLPGFEYASDHVALAVDLLLPEASGSPEA